MGAMASPAVRRPHRRPPRRTRWGRRIAGIIGTAGLLGTAVLMGTWIAPSPDPSPEVLAPAPAPAAKPKPHKQAAGKAKAKTKPKLTAKQLAARTAAVTVLRNQGYLPTREADYDPRHQLRVLIGYRNGDPLGPRRAFFFTGGRLIGNDSSSGRPTPQPGQAGNPLGTPAPG